MLFTLFKPKPIISIGLLLSALPLVTGQGIDQRQNSIDLALTLLGGSLAIGCYFVCCVRRCMQYDAENVVNERLEEKEIEINEEEDSDEHNNGMRHYIRIND